MSDPPAIITSDPLAPLEPPPGVPEPPRPGGTTTNQHFDSTTIDDLIDEARTAAVEAGGDFIAATGIATLLDRYRFPTEYEAPVVAVPDTVAIVERIEQRATEALLAADRAYRIAETLDGDDDPGVADLAAATSDASALAGGLQTDVRALGTLLLGVTAQQNESDAVHLVEHAVVLEVALRSEDTLLGDDLPIPAGQSEAELLTEIAGYVSRLLCEAPDRRGSAIRLVAPAGAESSTVRGGTIEISGDTTCIDVTITGELLVDHDDLLVALALAGWDLVELDPDTPAPGPLDVSTTFIAPVTVSEVARVVVRTLVDVLGADDVTAVDRLLGVVSRH